MLPWYQTLCSHAMLSHHAPMPHQAAILRHAPIRHTPAAAAPHAMFPHHVPMPCVHAMLQHAMPYHAPMQGPSQDPPPAPGASKARRSLSMASSPPSTQHSALSTHHSAPSVPHSMHSISHSAPRSVQSMPSAALSTLHGAAVLGALWGMQVALGVATAQPYPPSHPTPAAEAWVQLPVPVTSTFLPQQAQQQAAVSSTPLLRSVHSAGWVFACCDMFSGSRLLVTGANRMAVKVCLMIIRS